MNDEDLYYLSTQYLGKKGITIPCVRAMATILTGAYRPEKITIVVGPERVLFLVWNWFYPGTTIIADGFGTHSGEGGRGLSTVLGLIKFYKVTLLQAWVYDKEAFDELAQGVLTEAMFDSVQGAQPYKWDFHPLPEVQKIKRGKQQFLEVKREGDVNFIFEMQLP